MASTKPALVFVHGAWHHAEHYRKFFSPLESAGFVVECPELPTCNDVRPPQKTPEDDVAEVRSTIQRLSEKGHPILVMGHSYGGVVTSNAVSDDLLLSVRSTQQGAASSLASGVGGVVHVIYMCAFLLPIKQNIVASLSTPPFSELQVEVAEDKSSRVLNGPPLFYNDLPEAEAIHWTDLLSPNMTITHQAMQVQHEPWRHVPTTYIYCIKDKGLPFGKQQQLVDDVRGNVRDLREDTLDASHSPFLSMPKRLATLVEQAWERTKVS